MSRDWRFLSFGILAACIVCLIGWLVVSAFPHTRGAAARIDTRTRMPVAKPKVNSLALVRSQMDVDIMDAKAHLDDLLLHFNDRHPDVIAARRRLADLQKRRLEFENAWAREQTECPQAEEDPKERQYRSVADRLDQVEWSDQDGLCYRFYPVELGSH